MKLDLKNTRIVQFSTFLLIFMATFHGILTAGNYQAISFIFISHILGIMLLFITYPLNKLKFVNVDKLFLVLWFLLASTIFLSEIIHLEILEAPFMLICIPFFYFLLYPLLAKKSIIIYYSIFVLGIPFVGFVLLMMLKKHQFATNSIALTILTSAIALLVIQKTFIEKKQFTFFIVSDILSLIAFGCITYVGSRTSMITFIVVYVVNVLLNLFTVKVTQSPLKQKMKLYYILGFILIIAIFYLNLEQGLRLFNKWNADISSGRTRIWFHSLTEFEFLGHGYEYYRNNPHIGVGPHNALISLLAFNGPIPMILLFVVLVKLFFDVLITRKIKDNLMNYQNLILVTTGFLICGIFEGLFHIPIYRPLNLLWFMELGNFYIKSNPPKISNHPHTVVQSKYMLMAIVIVVALSLVLVEGDGNIFSILKLADRYF